MRNEELLDRVIEGLIKDVDGTPTGTEEHKEKVEALVKVLDRSIEMKKVEMDADDKEANRKYDMQLKVQQMEDEKYDRMIKNGVAIASLVTGVGVTVWGCLKSWKFEEVGTITSQPGREFIKKAVNFFARK